jgi:hypothetical protein
MQKSRCEMAVIGCKIFIIKRIATTSPNFPHNNYEVDNDPAASSEHAKRILKNDLNSQITQKVLGPCK